MSSSEFDPFVLAAATRHGIALYIVFVLLAQGTAFFAGVRMGRRRSTISSFPLLLGLLLANTFSFLAFASLAGEFPKQLWFATFVITVAAWLAQWLLAWTASKSEVEFNIQKVSRDTRIVQAIVTAGVPIWMALTGITLILSFTFQYGLLIYCGFLFDPAQMGNATYQAEIATFLLVLPAALVGIGLLIGQIALLVSKYTTPTVRNICLAGAVGLLANSLMLVFGPLYFYRDGFPTMASVVPTLGTLAVSASGVFAALLIIPYAVGSLTNLRLTTNLRASLLTLIDRAEELSKRPPGALRENEEHLLQARIIEAYGPLTRNRLLRYFALKLLETFAEHPGTDAARQHRLMTLRMFGFGTEAPFEGDALAEIAQIRANIAQHPLYRFNPPVQEFFDLVEKDFDGVAQAHPLLLNFQRLTTVLRALVDEISDRERRYIFLDQRPRKIATGKMWPLIKQTLPGWMMGFIMTYVASPFSEALGSKVRAVFESLIKVLFGAA